MLSSVDEMQQESSWREYSSPSLPGPPSAGATSLTSGGGGEGSVSQQHQQQQDEGVSDDFDQNLVDIVASDRNILTSSSDPASRMGSSALEKWQMNRSASTRAMAGGANLGGRGGSGGEISVMGGTVGAQRRSADSQQSGMSRASATFEGNFWNCLA